MAFFVSIYSLPLRKTWTHTGKAPLIRMAKVYKMISVYKTNKNGISAVRRSERMSVMNIEKLFSKKALFLKNSIYYFGNEQDGDMFDEEDFNVWENTDLYSQRSAYLLENRTSDFLIDSIVKNEDFIIDLATGPSMGFIPAIKQKSSIFCVASDANLKVLEKHSESIDRFAPIGFAQFSALDIPFRNNSVSAYSSFIGISSTRNSFEGYLQVLSEIRRTLRAGGRLYAIENEWTDIPKILELFKANSMQPWDCFLQEHKPWENLFAECGFSILFNEIFEQRKLTSTDNALGAMAAKCQVDIGLRFIGFILQKI